MSKELVDHLRTEVLYVSGNPGYNLPSTTIMFLEEAADEIDRLNGIIEAAKEWADARLSFIALGANDPSSRQALNRLSDAENALCILSKAHKVKE